MSMTMDSTPYEAASGAELLDAVVVGAGFAGLYALHRLRERGLTVQVIERAPDVGGTWFWNAYPGARCDVESMDYSYSFSPELEQEWTWTEKYASQPEILAYLRHVTDRFDLRKDINFDTRVIGAVFDEVANVWEITTDGGRTFRARFCIFATGSLSAPLPPPFEGYEEFAGEWYQTSNWPHQKVDFQGKRVAIIGTGSSGVQATPVIAEIADQVTVFQRTPNFSVPGRNRPLEEAEIAERKAGYREHRHTQRTSPSGVPLEVGEKSALELSKEERDAEMERRWGLGGAPIFNVSFNDIMTNKASNDLVAEFVRDKIRGKVEDPALAESLIPTDHPFAAKRLCVDNGYFETFNRDNVALVNVRDNPIRRIRPEGVELSDGTVHDADIIVYALGYDAISGSLLRVDIRGREGRQLQAAWADGPSTYLGLMVAGFPNLFTVTGPGSPAVLAVMVVAIEQHIEWIDQCIADVQASGKHVIEADQAAQDSWTKHVDEIAQGTVFPLATNSYYVGANVPGKPRVFALYAGGQNIYRDRCEEISKNGYEGFNIS